jgi:hypothetical protein
LVPPQLWLFASIGAASGNTNVAKGAVVVEHATPVLAPATTRLEMTAAFRISRRRDTA